MECMYLPSLHMVRHLSLVRSCCLTAIDRMLTASVLLMSVHPLFVINHLKMAGKCIPGPRCSIVSLVPLKACARHTISSCSFMPLQGGSR